MPSLSVPGYASSEATTAHKRPTQTCAVKSWTKDVALRRFTASFPVKEFRVIDRITIKGLTATGRHGVFPEERRDGQIFIVDVVMGLDVDTESDDLSRTVNYADVADDVIAIIAGEAFNLIETVAGRVADQCLTYSGIAEVEVTVHKPQAPVQHEFTDLSVTIHRSRHDQRPL